MKRIFAITLALAASLPLQLAAEPPKSSLVDLAANAVGLASERLSAVQSPAELKSLLQQKRFHDAWVFAVQECESDPNSPTGWLLRCQVRQAEGKLDEASREAENAVRRFAASAAALQSRAACHYEKGQFEEAARDLTEAIQRGGDRSTLLGNRGLVLTILGRDEEALADLNAVPVDQRTRTTWMAIVGSLIRLRQLDAAELAATDAAKAFPLEGKAVLLAATVASARGNTRAAVDAARKAVELEPASSSLRSTLAAMLVLEGAPEAAFYEQNEAVRLALTDAERAERLCGRADLLARDGQRQEAIADLKVAKTLDPSKILYPYMLMIRYAEAFDVPSSRKELDGIIDRVKQGTLDPSGNSLAALYWVRSRQCAALGQNDDALADASAAVAADPKSAKYLVERAECHRALRQLAPARDDLAAAIDGVLRKTLSARDVELPNLYRRRATINLFLGDQAAYEADRAEADRLEKEEASKEAGKP